MLMSLGQFVFGLDTVPFDTLRRSSAYRHPSNPRVGALPGRQFVGAGDDTITISGVLAPEYAGSTKSLQQLRDMAGGGKAWALVSGAGHVFGAFVIENVNETSTLFTDNGLARRIEFDMQLTRVDDYLAEGSGGMEPWPDDDYWDWWL